MASAPVRTAARASVRGPGSRVSSWMLSIWPSLRAAPRRRRRWEARASAVRGDQGPGGAAGGGGLPAGGRQPDPVPGAGGGRRRPGPRRRAGAGGARGGLGGAGPDHRLRERGHDREGGGAAAGGAEPARPDGAAPDAAGALRVAVHADGPQLGKLSVRRGKRRADPDRLRRVPGVRPRVRGRVPAAGPRRGGRGRARASAKERGDGVSDGRGGGNHAGGARAERDDGGGAVSKEGRAVRFRQIPDLGEDLGARGGVHGTSAHPSAQRGVFAAPETCRGVHAVHKAGCGDTLPRSVGGSFGELHLSGQQVIHNHWRIALSSTTLPMVLENAAINLVVVVVHNFLSGVSKHTMTFILQL
mmetsp:Transcript_6805/g.14672  ORF Transcript_6805/g.14672 Transcript_6805/m.14672 type:complete len:358 (-) Transcript_6805:221-1294(-)